MAGDDISIQAWLGGRWATVGSDSADELGHFSVVVYRLLAPGTRFRAVHAASTTCARSVSLTHVVPEWRPRPKVTVKAVSSRSKLFVDVRGAGRRRTASTDCSPP